MTLGSTGGVRIARVFERMTEARTKHDVIPASAVRRVDAPVLVECSVNAEGRTDAIAVIPLAEDGVIQGFEVRCRCGSSVIVECVYEEKEPT